MAVELTKDVRVPTAATVFTTLFSLGVVAGLAVGIFYAPGLGPLVGWDTLALGYVATTWSRVRRYDASLVKRHALREDPSRVATDVLLVVASIASLAAVGILLISSQNASGAKEYLSAGLAIVSVIASWLMVHTVYALRYARLYYAKPEGGIDFGDDKPVYSDFAYLAFTMGMTFQVSDTGFTSRELRSTALRHALLAYLLGTVIIATTINLVASLGN